MIEATYILTIDDFMDAVRERFRRDPANIRIRVGYIVIGVGLIAVFVEKLPLAYWLIFVGVFLAWWGIRSPARRLKNYYQRSVTNEQIVAQIDENGVTTVSPTGRSEMKWVGFAYVLETPKTFSLYTIGNIMFVFPKRAFDEQSCEELRKLVVNNGIPTKPR
jgi:YcxB-like protein